MSIFLSFNLDSVVLDGKCHSLYFSVIVVAWTSSVLMLEREAQFRNSKEFYPICSLS